MENEAPQMLTVGQAAYNAGVAYLLAFFVLYGAAYKRLGSDAFFFVTWFVANQNRWINGVITLALFSSLSVLIPDIGEVAANVFGVNLNAKVPVSLGLGLAAWLSLTSKAKDPPAEQVVDPIPND